MEPVVILSRQEQEYLLRAIESGLRVASMRQFFLWTQGQLQALLPHQVMVALQFAPSGALRRLECLHATVLAPQAASLLADRRDGLALRIARHCQQGARLPAMAELSDSKVGGKAGGVLGGFEKELREAGFDSVLVHGTGATAEGASVFVLFGLPMRPGPRHAYFLELLLAHLHLALLRLPSPAARRAGGPARPLSERETEIVGWLREGKSNEEMAQILGISALTVKNHLQRIYRLLGVGNRAHALARCLELRLLEA
ncbi:LuxR C-terminal-related transcriptional regulator [Massilia norwichensis]|uniref:LuxR C-terminal-related transcriptional regulator n=1 Tax=Massilia norwichensis TaxID=1442366 RepID=A0ABT2A6A8_9BURK|nr:LuxR C-terminal-related transcriptional regulator [Massilia norwichensis]MCS0589365.1 LuxR C-terminal-related transcriptional regulator [Massilia norwichensis]